MKKIVTVVFALMMTGSVFTVQAAAKSETSAGVENIATGEDAAKLEAIKERVDEIQAMDKSALSKSERKELRAELKGLKQEASRRGGGVYLPTAAVILLIILLLVLII